MELPDHLAPSLVMQVVDILRDNAVQSAGGFHGCQRVVGFVGFRGQGRAHREQHFYPGSAR